MWRCHLQRPSSLASTVSHPPAPAATSRRFCGERHKPPSKAVELQLQSLFPSLPGFWCHLQAERSWILRTGASGGYRHRRLCKPFPSDRSCGLRQTSPQSPSCRLSWSSRAGAAGTRSDPWQAALWRFLGVEMTISINFGLQVFEALAYWERMDFFAERRILRWKIISFISTATNQYPPSFTAPYQNVTLVAGKKKGLGKKCLL